jgi:hypothetical protein
MGHGNINVVILRTCGNRRAEWLSAFRDFRKETRAKDHKLDFRCLWPKLEKGFMETEPVCFQTVLLAVSESDRFSGRQHPNPILQILKPTRNRNETLGAGRTYLRNPIKPEITSLFATFFKCSRPRPPKHKSFSGPF